MVIFSALLEALWPLRHPPGKMKEEDPLPIDEHLYSDYEKPVADVYAEFIEYSISTSQSLDIICRPWAARPMRSTLFQKIMRVENENSGSMAVNSRPSWILYIESGALGDVSRIPAGRINGDSFVGPPQRQRYKASASLAPHVEFGNSLWREES